MDRLKSFFPTAVLLAIVLFVSIFVTAHYVPVSSPVSPTASSTLQIIPDSSSPLPAPAVTPAPSTPLTTASSTPRPAIKAAPPKVVKPVEPVEPVAITLSSNQITVVLNDALNAGSASLRAALVNIICYASPGSPFHSISGSGIVIDSKGIILTNAHIAQYFLLADRGVSCKVRSGSPAADAYSAALLYIPPAWVNTNAALLTAANPTGTGEYDFALIGITGSLTSTPLPTSYASLPLATLALAVGAPVVIGSYGAQFLDYTQIQSDLFPTIVFGSVKAIYTFSTNSIDVFALGGSAAAQEGSSGGGMINAVGELAGTITTSTTQGTTDTRELDAISASYIRAEYARETGGSLDDLLAAPIATSIANFAGAARHLEDTLLAALPQS